MPVFRKIFVALVFFFSFTVWAQNFTDATDFYLKGDYEKAIAVAREEIDGGSEEIDSFVVLVWSLIDTGRIHEAFYWAQRGSRLDKYDVRLIESIGEIHYFLGNNDDALDFFRQYISLATIGEKKPEVYYFMGEIYLRQQKFNHADIAFSRAVLFEPFDDTWWVKLGYAREMCGRYMNAVDAYEEALKINSNNSDAISGKKRAGDRV
jgi:tetratricopeptide (TPR) repeat protein